MKRRILFSMVVGIVVLGAGLYFFGFSNGNLQILAVNVFQTDENAQEPNEPENLEQFDAQIQTVLVEKAVLKPKVLHRKYLGTFEPIKSVQVISRISGDIEEQLFQEGNHVEKEEVLFEIEKVRYEAALEAANANVAAQKAQIATSEARISQAEARLKYAQNNYDRNQTLYEKGGSIVTKDAVENSKSILDAQISELASLNAENLSAKAGLDAALAELKLAEDDMRHTTIRAMISGRIGRAEQTIGNFVTPQSGSLVSIVQIDPIYLRFSISEPDFTSMFGNLENLKKHSSIKIELANGQFYEEEGEISFIDNKLTEATNTINVWATFRNSKEFLNPGGVSTVYLNKKEDVLLPAVKTTALMFDGRHHSIYVVGKDNLVEKRVVEPASTDGQYQTIASGLNEGEIVIIDGTHKIQMIPGPDGKPLPVSVNVTYTPTPEAATENAASENTTSEISTSENVPSENVPLENLSDSSASAVTGEADQTAQSSAEGERQ